jgi:CRP-like cAMP-binding protein
MGALLLVAILTPTGCIVVSLFITTLIRCQSARYVLENQQNENKSLMNRALKNLGIPRELSSRVLALHAFQKMGHDWQAFDALFNKKNLSPPLELALRVFLYHDSVLCCPLYTDANDSNYMLEVIGGLVDQIFLPGDFVTRRGQVCSTMYFVVRGRLSVLVPDPTATGERTVMNTSEVSVKVRGDYFGEIALIQDCVRTAWVRANEYVLLAVLHREHAESLWKHYPKERKRLMDIVVETARMDRARKNTQTFDDDDGALTENPASNALMQMAEGEVNGSSEDLGSPSPGLNRGFIRAGSASSDLRGSSESCLTEIQELKRLMLQHHYENRAAHSDNKRQLVQLQARQYAVEQGVERVLASTSGDVLPPARPPEKKVTIVAPDSVALSISPNAASPPAQAPGEAGTRKPPFSLARRMSGSGAVQPVQPPERVQPPPGQYDIDSWAAQMSSAAISSESLSPVVPLPIPSDAGSNGHTARHGHIRPQSAPAPNECGAPGAAVGKVATGRSLPMAKTGTAGSRLPHFSVYDPYYASLE